MTDERDDVTRDLDELRDRLAGMDDGGAAQVEIERTGDDLRDFREELSDKNERRRERRDATPE